MSDKVYLISFKNDLESYKKFSDLKRGFQTSLYIISEMALIERNEENYSLKEGFDSGFETKNDTRKGTMIGALVGIIGGPFGVLFGSLTGNLIGSSVDVRDALNNQNIIIKMTETMPVGGCAIIALVRENEAGAFKKEFDGFDVDIVETTSDQVRKDIEEAQKLEKEQQKLDKKAKKEEKKNAKKK